ncbi:hypothetical protein P7H30_03755 [Streptococcus parauberis]|uniref:hypothetical protein n=1 Tax=Streptococcus parauberis TaxID=1348 RepID=UPI00288E8AD1|nr:hypothetical protein [Streptococcus parauberis]MDT2748865.1 hypothetical protein [Streptococcus parauberis]
MTETNQFVGALVVREDDYQYTCKNLKEFDEQGNKIGDPTITISKSQARYILENIPNAQSQLLISKELAEKDYPESKWVSVKEL